MTIFRIEVEVEIVTWGSETPSMADVSFIGAVKDEWQLYRFFNFVSIHIYFTYHFL